MAKQLSARSRAGTAAWCGTLALLLALSIVACVGIGPVLIPFPTVWRVIGGRLFDARLLAGIPLNTQNIIWTLRVPRVLLAALVGSCLTLSGIAMQAFTQNPLASPYVLGISSGASFGAIAAMAGGALPLLGRSSVPAGAFMGSLAAIVLVYALAKNGPEVAPIRLVLVGMAVSALFTSFGNLIVYKAPDEQKIRNVTFWLLGSLASAGWKDLAFPAAVLPCGALALAALSKSLNAMMMGESSAVTLGVNVARDRTVTIFVSALLTGTAVAAAGSIGFIGLIVPHILRCAVGADHRRLIPLSPLAGAIFLIWADVAARMIDAPSEMPIGIITSILGAPLFLWMVKARRYSFGGRT